MIFEVVFKYLQKVFKGDDPIPYYHERVNVQDMADLIKEHKDTIGKRSECAILHHAIRLAEEWECPLGKIVIYFRSEATDYNPMFIPYPRET